MSSIESSAFTISVVIPSYRRGAVLLKTLATLQSQEVRPTEIIVIDQTDYVSGDTVAAQLKRLHDYDVIHWVQRQQPSIPKAMNDGLTRATGDYVLFLDDDIEFDSQFIRKHLIALNEFRPMAQVGQIVQPWQRAGETAAKVDKQGIYKHLDFAFNGSERAEIENCMAGNLCVLRETAKNIGGFDENFVGAAYRFETEFCRRMIRMTGQRFRFEPSASIDHLHLKSGGTRVSTSYLQSASASHSVGDYYFALLEGRGWQKYRYIAVRMFGGLVAKFYLRRPWYLPTRLIGEVRGLLLALELKRNGQQLLQGSDQ